jgi:hypothetical protein
MIYRRFGIRNKGGLNGLVVMHLVKAQPSPKRATLTNLVDELTRLV